MAEKGAAPVGGEAEGTEDRRSTSAAAEAAESRDEDGLKLFVGPDAKLMQGAENSDRIGSNMSLFSKTKGDSGVDRGSASTAEGHSAASVTKTNPSVLLAGVRRYTSP